MTIFDYLKRYGGAAGSLAGALALTLIAAGLFKGCGGPAPSPEPPAAIVLPVEVKVGPGRMVEIAAETRGKLVRWHVHEEVQLKTLDAKTVIVAAEKPGIYKILAWTSVSAGWFGRSEPTEAAQCTLIVGDIPPPGPSPGPQPGPPKPAKELRAIFVYEKGDKTTAAQLAVIYSPKVSAWLDGHCKGGKDGWRRWDPDISTQYVPETWKKIWEATKPQLNLMPALVIFNGLEGQVYPLPKSEDEALAILKNYVSE